jgi:hypothetical protein
MTWDISLPKRQRSQVKTNQLKKSQLQNQSRNNQKNKLKNLNKQLKNNGDVECEDEVHRDLKDVTMTTWKWQSKLNKRNSSSKNSILSSDSLRHLRSEAEASQ